MRRLSLRSSLSVEIPARLQLPGLLAIAIALPGCAGGGASSGTPPPPPPTVSVSVAPPATNILLGKTAQFGATVSGATNTAVAWSVNGISGGNASLGSISPSGLYTAPADLPSPATVQITAASLAAPAATGSAQVTVISDISIGLSPSGASVELGAKQNFTAIVNSSGLPDTAIRWALSGGACPACGKINSVGNYTAPQILPASPTVVITAQSVADPSKQASVNAILTSHFTLQLAAPGALSPYATATIAATLTPAPGSNPSTALNWSLSGAGCNASSCGTLSSVTTQIQGATSIGGAATENANYTAPNSAPSPNSITITAIPLADPSKSAQATLTIQPGTGFFIQPGSATLAVNHRITFVLQTNGAATSSVNWSVNGAAAGNSALGQICAVGSNPCTPVTSSSASTQVDYLAPSAIPSTNPVAVKAASADDSTLFATAQVTILNHIVVSVLPASVTLAPGATQSFTASVFGSTDQSVVWQIQGTGCSAGACGSISSAGNYTAPGTSPVPNSLQVVAISSDDTAQSGTANVTIAAGANLVSLHPASVYAGAVLGFVLRVDGGGFLLTNPGPGSALLVGGTPRTTSCLSNTECTAAVFPFDVSTAGNLTIQVQNPDGSHSNTLSLVVAPSNSTDSTIALTGANPNATGKDITVVEPTSAGVSVPTSDVDLDVAALGSFSVATNSCSLRGNPIVLARPSSGAATFDICLFSQSGLDTSMTYTVTGPGDVSVLAKQPAGLGIVHLTLQVQSNAQPGVRTLFVQNLNLDKTAASGVLEVQ
jgi:hypothetical protein